MTILPDTPQTGYYRTKLVRGGIFVAVKIWYGPPLDPEDYSQTLARSWRWQALVDGELYMGNVLDVWTFCAGRPVSEAEYRFMLATATHHRTHDTGHPSAEPRKPVDFNKIPLVF